MIKIGDAKTRTGRPVAQCKRQSHREIWTFWTYLTDVKSTIWTLTEKLTGMIMLTCFLLGQILGSMPTTFSRCSTYNTAELSASRCVLLLHRPILRRVKHRGRP